MFEKKLIEELLGITKPWRIEELVMEAERQTIVVRVSCGEEVWGVDGKRWHIQGWEVRRWRHLDLWQLKTEIEARVPRVKDPETGETQMVRVPWAEKHQRHTRLFEQHALEVVGISRTLEQARKHLGVTWKMLEAVMRRAVERGLERRSLEGLEAVGVDEKSFRSGQDYVALMSDLKAGRVLEVVEGAGEPRVVALWEALPQQQRQEVKAAAMDRGAAMISGTRAAAPQALIVHDRYHISAELGRMVDQTRRAEHKRLSRQGDDGLAGSRFDWLGGMDRLEGARLERFDRLVRRYGKVGRAWSMKELFAEFWQQPDALSAHRFFKDWKRLAMRSRNKLLKKLALSLEKSLPYLLNYFSHRITNAMTEGFNSVIQQIKAAARGFRSFQSYRTRILFFCGKLDLSLS
jgi:transposase